MRYNGLNNMFFPLCLINDNHSVTKCLNFLHDMRRKNYCLIFAQVFDKLTYIHQLIHIQP